ncbi:hypothetical protein AN958_00490 [Leucoagaricus sp. SymC.cos]|nr:hypothetical protein AN958_00490 [Leucoagaricus sp. SymC.cos]
MRGGGSNSALYLNGLVKVVSRKQNTNGPMMKETVEEIVGRGMVMFNIGSGSDAGSKSTGSGSEMNGNNGNRKEWSVSAVEEESLMLSMESRQMEGEDELDSAHMKDGTPIAPVIPPVEKVQSPRRSQAKGKEKETVTFVEKEKPSKGKGKERVKSPATKSSTILPHVEATIGDPLLPSKGRQVILDSDSDDFETETPAQAQAQHPVRPLVSRVHSHQIARNAKQLSRAQMQQRLAEQRVEERKWKEEMFVKLPKSSFQNLTEIARTRSAGLLTQLLKPDLQLLPHDHPYRRGFSSGMIQPLRPFTPLAPAQPFPQQHQHQHQHSHPQVARPQPPSTPAPPPVQAPPVLQRSVTETPDQPPQHSRQPSRTYQLPKHMAALTNPGLVGAAAKTPVATAVMSELRVGSISGTKQTTTGGVSVNESANGNATTATVVEDESDGESDDAENQLDLSKSVAQEKLKALLEAKKLKKSALVAQQEKQQQEDEAYRDQQQFGVVGVGGQEGSSQLVEPMNIPPSRLHYPYNLPSPNPSTTPRTTRRKMLAVEIPESLRRNLLWERQVSQAYPRGLKKSASSNDVVKGWEIPNVVKLTPKGVKPDDQKDKKDESRRRYLARTRSWLFEYHVTGW